MIKETIKHKGIVLIRSSLGKKWIIENTITNAFNSELAKAIVYGSTPDCYMTHINIGTGTTPPTKEDTDVEAGVFTTGVLSQTVTGYGQVMSEFTILDSDYAGQIEEIGFFGGSGILLLSRILWSYNKSSAEELYFQRFDTLV